MAASAPSPRGPSLSSAGRNYRFRRLGLALVLRDMRFGPGELGPGDRVPAFDLPVLGGGRIGDRDLPATGPLLLIFGSATCPVTDSAAPGLASLHGAFGDRVRFVLVNVREAHPGGNLPQPHTEAAKLAHADMLRLVHDIPYEVAVDDVDGTLHRAFGPKPNSAYLIGRDGTIQFRAHWANDHDALARALSQVIAGRRPSPESAGGTMRATVKMLPHLAPVLDRAGRGAWADMWRVAAPLALLATVLGWRGRRRVTRAAAPATSRRA